MLAHTGHLGTAWVGEVELEAPWAECLYLVGRGLLAALPDIWLSGLTWGGIFIGIFYWSSWRSCRAWCWCLWYMPQIVFSASWLFQAFQSTKPIFLSNNDIAFYKSHYFIDYFYLCIGCSEQSHFVFSHFSLLPPQFMLNANELLEYYMSE